MSKIIYKCHVSLNGLIELPGGAPDWVIADEELFRFSNNLERQVGGYLWGRGMYENNMALWATADPQSMEPYGIEFMQIWKQIPTIVFSSTLKRVEGNARLERGDPVAVVDPPERAAWVGSEHRRSAACLDAHPGRPG